MAKSLEAGYFDKLYAHDPDPWKFTTSAYEDAKYSATLAALPRERYASAVEIGCSIGVLTERLAARCDHLLGLDVAQAALDAAAKRCAALPHVEFALSGRPATPPTGTFDLIMLSEIIYYFDRDGVAAMARAVAGMARPGADVMLIHWLGPTPDYPLDGETAVTAFLDAATAGARGATMVAQDRTPEYRLDVLRFPAG
ncbi:SAM-dependent methyltransferase [Glacieibacterium megasporae]|uniref:SAM-dependent methyltransferase n=1 Tax=Glacieibacterium megasporae TaxID=2835787 RepID=UPI00210505DB|nr:SAM-dependent methyltransferase [Polymorphobacter megasporae]